MTFEAYVEGTCSDEEPYVVCLDADGPGSSVKFSLRLTLSEAKAAWKELNEAILEIEETLAEDAP